MLNNKTLVFLLVLSFVLSLGKSIGHAQTSHVPPFNAWISSYEDIFVRPTDNTGQSIALLRYGDMVRVVRCIPDCNSLSSLAQLSPFGLVRLSVLNTTEPRDRLGSFLAGPPTFTWAKTKTSGVVSRQTPSSSGAIIERFGTGDELIFRTNSDLQTRGYLERPNGGFVSTAHLEIFEPSTFSGWQNPPDSFVFVLNDTAYTKSSSEIINTRRYDRYESVFTDSHHSTILVPGNNRRRRDSATIPRTDIRYGHKRNHPEGIPNGVKWVHVDLNQQILTAYDSSNDLVFATLVSTGRRRNSTHTGIFQVRRKITYTQMRGGGSRPYSVEGVRFTQYMTNLNEDVALHESFWHDSFGYVRSHGCINLSPRDALYLFEFNPAQIPFGWRSIHPIALELDNLWIQIE
jgi:lipoprotein-anchoring transpeptidase ErfK/SrfK